MKIKELKLNALINVGPYSHVTMDITAEVSEGEDTLTILENFKSRVQMIMNGEPVGQNKAIVSETEVESVGASANVKVPVAVEEKPKQNRNRKPKEEVKVGEVKAEVVEEVKETPKPNKSKITPYGADNKAVLQAYLTKKYAEAWKSIKPRNEIIEFTSKLPGMDFLDEDGNIVPSFLEHIHSFFGQ